MKRTPGPPPSSCLTCRQRKIRCDKARPACSRCLASGIACMGYDHIPAEDSWSFYVFGFDGGQPAACEPEINNRVCGHDEELQMGISDVRVDCRETMLAFNTPAHGAVRSIRSDPLADGYLLSGADDLVQSTFSLSNVPEELVDPGALFRLPPMIITDPVLSGEIPEFIISQFGPLLEMLQFKPAQGFLEMARKRITRRIYSSSLARYSMYTGARILQALANDGKRADLRYLSSYLGIFEQELCIRSANESTFDGLAGILTTGLELAFVYFVTSNSQAGYTLLRNLRPTFHQATLLGFGLFSCHSLAHALNPPHLAIYRFILMDIFTSITFGIPPLIEYDTSISQLPATCVWSMDKISPTDAVPELVPEFIMILVKIINWRAKNPGQSAPEGIWKPLEAEAWTCQQGVDVPVEEVTLQLVARMAIVEGWRHAILIYLYMGMCGVASNDPRVQSSTKQIMQLLQVVRREDWNTMNHFFVPCLMASICTPNEKHRAELSDAFLKVENTKPWLFKMMDYKPVIDHLWHGAAANGRAVCWEDYVDSRRAMLHID